MQKIPPPQEFNTWIQELSTAVTHPEFLKALEELQSLPEAQRSEAISTQLTPQALAARGVPIPQGMRITTRYFENPDDRTISANVGTKKPNGNGESGPALPVVCVSGGIGKLCGTVGTPLLMPPPPPSED